MAVFSTDAAYKKYFEKNGELAITIPVKYGAFDLVQLLLDYGAVLDESCLKYAEEATESIGMGKAEMRKYLRGNAW
jgi:hypothetical protein